MWPGGVSFPCPLTPKASLLQSLSSTFSDFNQRSLKNPVNSTVPSHSIRTSLPQQPVERLVDAYRRVLQIKAHQACSDTPAVQKACLDTSWLAQVQHRSTADERQAFSKHQTATRLDSPASYPALYLQLPCSKPPYLHPRNLDVSRSRATALSPIGAPPCWTSYIFLPMTHRLS